MKITFIVVTIGLALLIVSLMGCALDTVGGIEPFYMADPEVAPIADAVIYYPNNIKISATDAPLEDKNLEKVRIKFNRMEVSMGDVDDENAEWIPINEEGGEFNLLELTNGTCQTLAMAQLGLGKYRQTRFEISEAFVEEDMKEHPVHLGSKMIRIGREFLVDEGLMTNLVLDFDAQRSLQKVDDRWIMTPVIRFVERYNTGAIVGQVVLPADLEEQVAETVEEPVVDPVEDPIEDPVVDPVEDPIEDPVEDPVEVSCEDPVEEPCEEPLKATVTAYKDGETTESYSSTIAHESGIFILGYMETGRYDIVIKAGDEDEYFLRVEDIDVVIGEVVKLGQLELTLKEEEPPIINTITVDVIDVVHPDIDGKPVYVTTFIGGGKITDDNVFETVKGEIMGTNVSIILDNTGEGYPDGIYGVRVHIDLPLLDGELTAEKDRDYVAVGEVTVSGGSANVEINGPWGTYFSLILKNPPEVLPPETTGRIYLTLVSEGDTWGNYAYGEAYFDSLARLYISMDCWAPDATYDLLAFIDANKIDGLDPGDFVTSLSIEVSGGSVTYPPDEIWYMPINSWTLVPEDAGL